MTYTKKLGVVSDRGLVAIDELLKQIDGLPSADVTFIDMTLCLNGGNCIAHNEIVSWDNGYAVIPILNYEGSVRPQYLIEAIKADAKDWPKQVSLKRELRGRNRSLEYTKELLRTARYFCQQGYTIEARSKVCLEGYSLDLNLTYCCVQLCVENEEYILTGISPLPQWPKTAKEQTRTGW